MRTSRFVLPAPMFLAIALLAGSSSARAQDAIYVNGRIVTLDAQSSVVEALAVREGRIIATGTSEEMRRFARPDSRIIDLRGRTVVPGFYDNHVHLAGDLQEWNGGLIGAASDWLQGVETIESLQRALVRRDAELPPAAWIEGSLPREIWPNQRVPTRWDLDAAAPDRPVALSRGPHTLLLNSVALERAGITRDTPNPDGGWIIRDDTGQPTGRVLEAARRLVERAMPARSTSPSGSATTGTTRSGASDATLDGYRDFLRRLTTAGVTSVNIAGVAPEDLRALQDLYDRWGPELPRATVQIRLRPGHDSYDDEERAITEETAKLEALGLRTGFGSDRLKVGAVKMSIDGGLSAPVFWSLQPYAGRPDFHGTQRITDHAFYRVARRAHELGWQLGIHTMGDAAAVMVVNALERILRELPRADHRHYLHHVAVRPPDETLRRMVDLGIGVASQPGFTIGLGAYADEALDGEREATQNPAGSLLDLGIHVSFGSDGAPYGPLFGIYAAVTRRGWDGRVRGPVEAVTVEQALRLYTLGSAYFSFDERTRGSLEPGKVADFTVLSDDILSIDPERIRDIHIERTVIGGTDVWIKEPTG